jgi:hypothetical protein
MLHACVKRFDVMGGRGNILGWDEVNKTLRLNGLWYLSSHLNVSFLIGRS